MNPVDIPREWILRLRCICGNPICYPDLDCTACLRRISEAMELRKVKAGIEF